MSKHFTVGTSVKIAHRPPAEIISRAGTVLTLRYPDGSIEHVEPMALKNLERR